MLTPIEGPDSCGVFLRTPKHQRDVCGHKAPPGTLAHDPIYLKGIVEVNAPAPVTRLLGPTEIATPPLNRLIPTPLLLRTLFWTPMILPVPFAPRSPYLREHKCS
jgi:hypothetical protein